LTISISFARFFIIKKILTNLFKNPNFACQMESTKQQPLEMNNNNSVTFEEKNTPAQKMITKIDGSKVVFDKATLKAYLARYLDGLNTDYINLDPIVEKVANGIYNGKSKIPRGPLRHPQSLLHTSHHLSYSVRVSRCKSPQLWKTFSLQA